MKIRLQKILAERGEISRREADRLLMAGKVLVNGTKANPGEKADPTVDVISIEDQVLKERAAEKIIVALWKPVDIVTSTKKTAGESHIVLDLLPPHLQSLYPVGRLDKDSSGLLLLTNDGQKAFQITHPGFSHQKLYEVLLTKPPEEADLQRIREGEVRILGKKIRPSPVRFLGGSRIEIILSEGKNRHIRRVFRALGNGVKKLRRVAIGRLFLRDLDIAEGQYRVLTKEEEHKIFQELPRTMPIFSAGKRLNTSFSR